MNIQTLSMVTNSWFFTMNWTFEAHFLHKYSCKQIRTKFLGIQIDKQDPVSMVVAGIESKTKTGCHTTGKVCSWLSAMSVKLSLPVKVDASQPYLAPNYQKSGLSYCTILNRFIFTQELMKLCLFWRICEFCLKNKPAILIFK